MWSASSSPLLPGPLRPELVVPVRVSSMGQVDRFKKIFVINMTMCKKISEKQSHKKVNMNVRRIGFLYLTYRLDPNKCNHSEPEWT